MFTLIGVRWFTEDQVARCASYGHADCAFSEYKWDRLARPAGGRAGGRRWRRATIRPGWENMSMCWTAGAQNGLLRLRLSRVLRATAAYRVTEWDLTWSRLRRP